MDKTINKIISLFSSSETEANLKEIYDLISNVKDNELGNIFGENNNITKDGNNFYYASVVFNSLFLVLNNLSFFQGQDKKDLAQKISNICYELFYSSFKADEKIDIDKLLFLSLYGIISDRVVEIDGIIIDNIEFIEYIDKVNNIKDLGANIKYLIILFLKKIKNKQDIDIIKNFLDKIKEQILFLQKSYNPDVFSNSDAIDLVGYTNLIYILDFFSEYLFNGTIKDENILTSIDIYCKNSIDAFKLSNNSFFINIAFLVKFSFGKIYNLSIWTFLSTHPLFKEYFVKLNQRDNYRFLSFFPSQIQALTDMFAYGKKAIILTMPTSSGKSILAELYILFNLKISELYDDNNKPLVVYIVPTNALLNQAKRDLEFKIGCLGYTIASILPINSIDTFEQTLLNDNVDILVTTPEKLDFLIRNKEPIIERLSFVVMDEAHNIGDDTRGSKFELVLSIIKQERMFENRVNFLLLSPFIENANNIGIWLGDNINNSTIVNIDWIPTKQYIGLMSYSKNNTLIEYMPSPRSGLYNNKNISFADNRENAYSKLKSLGFLDEEISNIFKIFISIKNLLPLETLLIISDGPRRAELICKNLIRFNLLEEIDLNNINNKKIANLIELIKLEYATENNDLINAIKYGIVFHHAQMPDSVKKEIEVLIGLGKFRVICSTTTLGQGMNLPIRTVIFDTLYPGRSKKMSSSTFWNIAGRAGRAFIDKDGHVVILHKSGSKKGLKEDLNKYIFDDAKELLSSLGKFFKQLDEVGYKIDITMIRNNPSISNFLQYINHVLNNKFDYNFDYINSVEIRKILSSSLIYTQLTENSGFDYSQEKISNFVNSYILYLKNRVENEKSEKQLKKADKLSISDISLGIVTGLSIGLKEEIGNHSTYDVVLNNDNEKLGKIINVLNSIPELRLGIRNEGEFNPYKIASIVSGWVNGTPVKEIAYSTGLEINECYKYINSELRNFITWGISIYQQINFEIDEKKSLLPSFIFYGVNNEKDLLLSISGVPRFALSMVKKIILNKKIDLSYNISNIDEIKTTILSFSESDYTKSNYKDIIDNNIRNS